MKINTFVIIIIILLLLIISSSASSSASSSLSSSSLVIALLHLFCHWFYIVDAVDERLVKTKKLFNPSNKPH